MNFFFPLTHLFLTFVVFACFATTRVNMRFRAQNTRDSAQDSIQCRKCIGSPVVRTDGHTDGCTDGRSRDYYVTTKIFWLDRLPNFLSNGAPLTRWRAGSAKNTVHVVVHVCLYELEVFQLLVFTSFSAEEFTALISGVLEFHYLFQVPFQGEKYSNYFMPLVYIY